MCSIILALHFSVGMFSISGDFPVIPYFDQTKSRRVGAGNKVCEHPRPTARPCADIPCLTRTLPAAPVGAVVVLAGPPAAGQLTPPAHHHPPLAKNRPLAIDRLARPACPASVPSRPHALAPAHLRARARARARACAPANVPPAACQPQVGWCVF